MTLGLLLHLEKRSTSAVSYLGTTQRISDKLTQADESSQIDTNRYL